MSFLFLIKLIIVAFITGTILLIARIIVSRVEWRKWLLAFLDFSGNTFWDRSVQQEIDYEVLVVVGIFIVGCLLLVKGNTEQNIANQLRRSGIITTGTVVDKRIEEHMNRGRLYYTYHLNCRFRNNRYVTQNVSKAIFERLRLNGQVKIRHLPKNPSISEIDGTEMWRRGATFTKVIGYIIIVVSIVMSLIRMPIWLEWNLERKMKRISYPK